MNGFRSLVAAACLLLISPSSNAQVRLESVSLAVGKADGTSQSWYDDAHDVPFIDAEVVFGLIRAEKAGISISGAVDAGYWRQQAPGTSPCDDCTVFSYRAPSIGTKAIFGLNRIPVPLSFFLGYTREFVKAHHAYGAGLLGNIAPAPSETLNLLELGMRASIRIPASLSIGFELVKIHELDNIRKDHQHDGWRPALRTAYLFD